MEYGRNGKVHPDKDEVYYSATGLVQFYYAGGNKGPRARANGKGGLLARGWWRQDANGSMAGPFSCLTAARTIGFDKKM